MSEFYVYWIKDAFSFHYFHKSEILYRFFTEYQQHDSKCYQLQFDYVTRAIPYQVILHHLKRKCLRDVSIKNSNNLILIEYQEESLQIQWNGRELVVKSETFESADKWIFEILRQIHSSFFILEKNRENYGWIAPVRKEVIL